MSKGADHAGTSPHIKIQPPEALVDAPVSIQLRGFPAVRMKRPGARWKEESGEHLLNLRALALSDRWETAMTLTLRPLRKAIRFAA
jgi:hypothetical protein